MQLKIVTEELSTIGAQFIHTIPVPKFHRWYGTNYLLKFLRNGRLGSLPECLSTEK